MTSSAAPHADAEVLSAGRVAVITGGASGIGLATARSCARRGMHVVVADQDAAALRQAAEAVGAEAGGGGGRVAAVQCDVADAAAVERLRDEAWHRFGGCDLLFLNAGIGGGGGPWDGVDRWRALVDVNIFGVVHGLAAFVPRMIAQRRRCVIAVTGSREGITTPPNDVCYNVTKAGVRVLAEGLEHKLRSTPGCLVSSRLLLPGVTATPIAYNTVRRIKGAAAAAKREAKAGGKEAMMAANGKAVPPDVVADLILGSVASGGPFYVICPGTTGVEEFKRSIQRHADDIIQQGPPLSQFKHLRARM